MTTSPSCQTGPCWSKVSSTLMPGPIAVCQSAPLETVNLLLLCKSLCKVRLMANDMYCLQIQLMDQIHVSVMVHCIGNFLEVYGLESILYVLFSKMTFFPPFLLIVSKNIYILSENRFVCSRNAFIQADIGLLFRTVCAWSIICTVQAAEAKDFYWLKCVTVSWPIITRYIMTCIQDAYNFCLELLIDELHLLNTKAQHVLALL